MKRILPFIILFLVVFLLVWLFYQWNQNADIQPGLNDDELTFGSSQVKPFELRERDPKDHQGVVKTSVKIAKEEATVPGEGSIYVSAHLPDGSSPQEVIVLCEPTLPAFAAADGGWRLEAVPAGRYNVSVIGGNLVPSALQSLEVEDGKELRLHFKVRRGVRPKGTVRDAADNTPIANAMVNFNGMASAKTDIDGRFAIEQLLPRTALDVITVGNDVYGTIPFRGLLVEDVGNMKLFLGGGKGVVHVEIVNATRKAIPQNAFLRVTLPPTYENRREVPLKGREVLKLEKMYSGSFRFELHFPDGDFPTQRIVHQVPMWQADKAPVTQIRFVLRSGATLKGSFKGPTSFTVGMKLQLRDMRNHVVAETTVDSKGNYRIDNLAPSQYVPVVVAGNVAHQLPLITIEGDGVVDRDVDPQRKKWVK